MSQKLSATSYVILALVERLQPATAYDIKRLAQSAVLNFWALPHTVLYSETRNLSAKGLLDADEETGGRRRRKFSLTPTGREALDAWRAEPTSDFLETRDPGLLHLFAGSDPKTLATAQLDRHRAQLAEYRQLAEAMDHEAELDTAAAALRSVLAAGLAIEETYVRFWTSVADHGLAR